VDRIAVIRIRGTVNLERKTRDTLKMFNLEKPNNCIIIDNRDSYKGMLQKVKDYVTFGELDKETLKELLLKWARLPGNKKIDEKYIKEKTGKTVDKFIDEFFEFKIDLDDLGIKKVFRLHPPRKGYRGVRLGYNQGGSLGYRGGDMVFLLKRMI